MDWRHLNLDYEPTHYSQRELIDLLVTSVSYKEIAYSKGISESAVSTRACTLYRNTGARDRFELCVWAVKKGYVEI